MATTTRTRANKTGVRPISSAASVVRAPRRPTGRAMAAMSNDVAESVTTGAHALHGAPGGPQFAPSTDLISELNNIDFAKLIGGPLQAAVAAQSAASLASIDFIKAVGFAEPANIGDTPKLIMTDFSYKRTVPGVNGGQPTEEEVEVKVPLLTIVTVPSIRIESVDINFNVKLNSVETQNISSKFGINASLGIKYGPVDFKVSASYQRSASTGIKVEKEYTMNVKVRATQDEMPAGLETVLGLLAKG